MNVELLAPAGSYESLKAAIQAGADAVYIGGEKFGARAYANNLDQDMLKDAIDYVHLYGKKLYLTVNTLLKNKELEDELYEYLLPYYQQGLDAVIVQDMGVLQFIRRNFKDLPIHASTQMTLTGTAGARLLEELGATRIVTARELSLEEIHKIHSQSKIEIESFIHGALCYCYSGQCLLSSMIGGRSGNRGRCAQPCRLPYAVTEGEKTLTTKKKGYPLSPKDMCTIEILPEIIESGVYSLKIEGRMKKPEYTAGVVRIYRKYIDLYQSNPKNYKVEKEDLQQLYDIYNRDGFNQGYYKTKNGPNMIALENRKQKEKEQGEKSSRNDALFQKLREDYILKSKKLPIQMKLTMYVGKPMTLEVKYKEHKVSVCTQEVQQAQKQPLSVQQIEKKITQTGQTAFEIAKLSLNIGEDVFLPIGKINEIRRMALEELEKKIVGQTRRDLVEAKEIVSDRHNVLPAENICIRASAETKEQFEILLHEQSIKGIYCDFALFSERNLEQEVKLFYKRAKSYEKEFYIALPRMVRYSQVDRIKEWIDKTIDYVDGFLVRNLEIYALMRELGILSKVIIDQNLYTYNDEASAFYHDQGVLRNTAPLELNYKELRNRNNQDSEMIVYGYCVMMVSAQCVKKSLDQCTKGNSTLKLKDRYKKEFVVKCNCNYCYNTIYNSIPYGLIKEYEQVKSLGFEQIRLEFTIESGKEVTDVVQLFTDAYIKGKVNQNERELTKGHFKRGVE